MKYFIFLFVLFFVSSINAETVVQMNGALATKASMFKEKTAVMRSTIFDFSAFAGRESQICCDDFLQKYSAEISSEKFFLGFVGNGIDLKDLLFVETRKSLILRCETLLEYVDDFKQIKDNRSVKERSLLKKPVKGSLDSFTQKLSFLREERDFSLHRMMVLLGAIAVQAICLDERVESGNNILKSCASINEDRFLQCFERVEKQEVLINELLQKFENISYKSLNRGKFIWIAVEACEFFRLMQYVNDNYEQVKRQLNEVDQKLNQACELLAGNKSAFKKVKVTFKKMLKHFENLLIKQRSMEFCWNCHALVAYAFCQELSYQELASCFFEANKDLSHYHLVIEGLKIISDVKRASLTNIYKYMLPYFNEFFEQAADSRRRDCKFGGDKVESKDSKILTSFFANKRGMAFLAEVSTKSLIQISSSTAYQLNEIMDVQSMLIDELCKKSRSQ